MVRITIRKKRQQAEYYIEDLGNNVELAMVKIPEGKFLMGSPEDELERWSRESPQHEVTVPEFYMGRYPITQGQWKTVVETTEKIERDLDSDPSRFKDDYENYKRWSRPVEKVSWLDAKEFCARLSQNTGREYRLPSEAEWEYACRARTTTPFHFGETITTNLANYCGIDREINQNTDSGSYGRGPKGEHREQTTPVGYFKVANLFGLYDMHGNVFEWCEDYWQDNYQDAPNDGRAWLSGNQNTTKVLRGGSWYDLPRRCRSAYRSYYLPSVTLDLIGFRVLRVPHV
ncbi:MULTISPECIES: formylglycine-generating enzyme family protein [Okeania]|uniref:Formylglycine-generating enzyme family protein n=1 Tax=Okeania hirsuta TaxID=1458930 RepID=A0A3N6Q2P3_9CYAN|nr:MULTISPECIES: formylglycine-generating enzyme family protein [Okeania]NET12672.1 formylglycine-generating enzyme family protein [Okeania sp. SIO1H6]NES78087.1 formylglycine-generating enzyme family protein [Okeania sp. SIO1H4]NES88011.1 formylglycine-generating enzyme family protein [Okeania sp. SIO2B9]NET18826.1 formylglycine-generating enzyme family protein [Okeania sp. SIO1H5]NET76852.1 formylglycine-generating enzyme family protein [Okeania sp. SIO1F9]